MLGQVRVARRQSSYAALRLPRLLRPWLRFPSPTAYLLGQALFCRLPRRPTRAPTNPLVLETNHRLSGRPELPRREKGLPGYWAVLSSPLLLFEKICGVVAIAFANNRTFGIRNGHSFRGHVPTAHTLAHLRFADLVTETVARLATGSGGLALGRAGFAPAGRRIEISWSDRIPPIPIAQQRLVAMFCPFPPGRRSSIFRRRPS